MKPAQPTPAQPADDKQQPPKGPTFRTGIDLVTVDVGVSDERGRPVSDLLAPDFVVKIDGEVRRIVSAEHVRIDVEAAKKQAKEESETETYFTTNLTPPNGRMIIIAVDQSNIRPGAARPLLDRRPREREDPYAAAPPLAFPGQRLRPDRPLWLWVPACAGTTAHTCILAARFARVVPE